MKKSFLSVILALVSWFTTATAQPSITVSGTMVQNLYIPVGSGNATLLEFRITNSPNSGEDIVFQNCTINFTGTLPSTIYNMYFSNSQGQFWGGGSATGNTIYLPGTVIAPGASETYYVRSDITWTCEASCFTSALLQVTAIGRTSGLSADIHGLSTSPHNVCITHPASRITIDSVPRTICQNAFFVPRYTALWTNTVGLCNTQLTASWNFGQNASISTWDHPSFPAVTFYQAGQHIIYLTLTDPITGSQQTVEDTIVVYPTLYQNISATNNAQLTCLNNTVLISSNATSAFGPHWYWNGTLVGTDTSQIATQPGQYTLVLTANNVCSQPSSPSITITREVFEVAVLINGTSADTFMHCSGKTTNLNALTNGSGSPYNYEWNTGEATQWIDATEAGTYGVTVTNNLGCTATDAVFAQLHTTTQPILTLSDPDGVSCATAPLTVETQADFVQYQWSPIYSSTNSVVAHQSGMYSVTVTDALGCTATSIPREVTIIAVPEVHLSADAGNCALIVEPAYAASYSWMLNGIGLNPDPGSRYLNATGTGWYSVYVTNPHSCPVESNAVYLDCTATGISETGEETKLSIFPNPAINSLHIASLQNIQNLTITDVTGNELQNAGSLQAQEKIVDISELASGIYFLKGIMNEKAFVKKFVKQ